MKRKGLLVKATLSLLLALVMLFSVTVLGASAKERDTTSFWQVSYTTRSDSADGAAKLSVMLNPELLSADNASDVDIEKLLEDIMNALYEITYDSVFVSRSVNAPTVVKASLGGNVLPDIDLSEINIDELEDFLREQLGGNNSDEAKKKLDKLMSGEYDRVIEIAVDRYLTNTGYTAEQIEAKTVSVMDSIIETLYGDEPEITEEKKQSSAERINEIVTVVTAARDNGESITLELEDLSAVSSVSVDGVSIFADTYFDVDGIIEVLESLPTLAEIKEMSDTRMLHTVRVSAEFVFGVIDFDLTVGFSGDCQSIRNLASVLDEYVGLSYGDGDLTVNVTVPEKLSDVLADAINEGKLPDDLKRKLFSLAGKNGEDIDLYLKDFTFADMKDMLAEVDLKGILDSSSLEDFFDVEGLTNDEILERIDELEDAYNRAMDIISKAIGKLPEDKLAITLLEVYDGDGVFSAAESLSVNLQELFSGFSEKYGVLLASFFNESEIDINASLTISFEAVNRVTFKDIDESIFADGFLPKGADVAFFAGVTENGGKQITGWRTDAGEFYTAAPDRDIVLYAYYGGHLESEIDSAVDATYNKGTKHTLTVSNTYFPLTDSYSFAYQWFCDSQLIDGATNSTYTVENVEDSGSYSCSVTVTDGTYSRTVLTEAVSVSILPAVIDVTGVRWNYTTPFVYDGTAKGVSLVGLPAGVTASYTVYNLNFEPISYAPTDAGAYITSVSLDYDRKNCTLYGNRFAYTLEWKIAKATYDMSGIGFSPTSVYYDGNAHSIAITGTLPEGVSVSYVGGGTAVGEYLVTAVFSGNTKNYNAILPMETKLTILAPTDASGDEDERSSFKIYNALGEFTVELNSEYPIDAAIDFKAYLKESSTLDNVDFNALLGGGKEIFFSEVYDLHFEDSIGEIDVYDNSFTVRILIPQGLRQKTNLKVLHVAGDGTASIIDGSARDGDYMVFTTDSFSLFAVIAVEDVDSLLWLWIILLIIIIIVIILIIFRRPEPENEAGQTEPTDGDSDVAEPESEDYGETEQPAEGTPEENVEEAPDETALEATEKIPEQTDEDKEPAPALTVTETVVEQTTEITEIAEQAAEEAPAERTEEAKHEEISEAEPETCAVGKPACETDIAKVNEDGSILVDGNTVFVRYRSSFTSRLIQSESQLQDYYTVIKNYILSFEGVKVRTSFGYEAFNLRRTQCVRLNVKGKALLVNLALDPAQYSESKYHFVDMSADKKYAEVPMQLKVKSERAMRYAIELIDEVMANLGVDQGEVPTVDYRMPYESNAELAKRGLVKVILPDGVKLTDTAVVKDADVGALLDTERADATLAEEAELIIDEKIAEGNAGQTERKLLIRYRGSFTSRLIQSPDRTQSFYTEIKNYLLSFAGVKCRTSWNYETYNKGREKLVRMNVKGKTLTVNLALAPEKYSQSKYHFTDVTADPNLEKLPMQMKVRSDRAKKYVLALIDELMQSIGAKQGDIPSVDYRMPYETNDELVKRGLMKLVLPKGASAEDARLVPQDVRDCFTVADDAASDVLDAVEQPEVTKNPLEIAETPETQSKPEPTEAVYADKVLADALVDDKTAEQSVEHIRVPHGKGKLCQVNIGELCEYFWDGETVTLSELKARGLVGRSCGRVKILADGIMTKSLTVIADKFSMQAVKMITLAGGTARQLD